MLAGYRFHFRPVLTVFTLLALGVLLALGTWQLKRLEWKRGLIAKVEARVEAEPMPFEEALARAEAGEDMEYTPVEISGEWMAQNEARVFGAINGKPGAFLFMPLMDQNERVVFINRGFAPQDVDDVAEPSGDADEIAGLFRYSEKLSPPASWFRSSEQSADGLWFVRDPNAFAAEAGIEAFSFYIDQFAVPGRAWPKGGTTRLDFNNRHLEYALTWFGLALTLAGVWLAFSLHRR